MNAADVCWGCGKPAPAGVCPGPHDERAWVPRAAANVYMVEGGRLPWNPLSQQVPWNKGLSTGPRVLESVRRRQREEARVRRAVERLAEVLGSCEQSRDPEELMDIARRVLRHGKVASS